MKTPWNDLPTRDERALVEVVGYLNDTLDELLSLAKHVAPAIEKIAYPEVFLVPDPRATGPASHLRVTPEEEKAMKRDAASITGERYWLVKTGGSTLDQTQLDVTELMTHHKLAGEAPYHQRDSPYQAIAWASGWDALRCALLGIKQS